MTKAEIKAFDEGFLQAATMRGEVALLVGDAEERDANEELLAQMAEMEKRLKSDEEELDQLRAGFQPHPDDYVRHVVRVAFSCGTLLGIGVGAVMFAALRRLWS